MPKAAKGAQREQCTPLNMSFQNKLVIRKRQALTKSRDVEQEVTLGPSQAFPSMFMPYIEGPKIGLNC